MKHYQSHTTNALVWQLFFTYIEWVVTIMYKTGSDFLHMFLLIGVNMTIVNVARE